MAFILASSAWDLLLGRNPLDPLAGRRLRRVLFEAKAGGGSHLELIRRFLLAPEASPPLKGQQSDSSSAADNNAPNDEDTGSGSHEGENDNVTGRLLIEDAFFDDGLHGLDVRLPRSGIQAWLWTGR